MLPCKRDVAPCPLLPPGPDLELALVPGNPDASPKRSVAPVAASPC